MAPTKTRTITRYRDSETGKLIPKEKAEKMPPSTVEKERLKIPIPPKPKKK
jgi:hypothetical protein